jgi:L-malate glycosyltransferase
MNILFITELYPLNTEDKTTSKALHNFVIEWIKQGHDVKVIRPNFVLSDIFAGKNTPKEGYYEYEGVKICNLNYFTPFLFKFMEKIPQELRFAEYNYVIGHMPYGILFANQFSATIRKPLICGFSFADMNVLTNPMYEFYFKSQHKEAYRRAKRIACGNSALQQHFEELLPKYASKAFVGHTGINMEITGSESSHPNGSSPFSGATSPFSSHSPFDSQSPFSSASPFSSPSPSFSAHPTSDSSVTKVLTCATLTPDKNIDKLILAIKNLPEFELTVIGEGYLMESLKKIEAKNVKFFGNLSHEKILEEMKQSKIFILPSVQETFCTTYFEAMVSGCITVGIKDDGMEGIIKDSENGFLCHPTEESIKSTLLKIKNLKETNWLVQNSINTVRQYSAAKCAAEYIENMQKKEPKIFHKPK